MGRQPQGTLSARELEVLALVAAGLTNAEVAGKLVLAPATVKTHVEHIIGKLGAAGRTQAVAIAFEQGLVGGAVNGTTRPTHAQPGELPIYSASPRNIAPVRGFSSPGRPTESPSPT